MKVKALESFSGAFSMYQGEVRELNNEATLKDLLKARFIEEVKEEPNKEDELQKEIEELKKELEELKKLPATPDEEPEPQKDVKSSESKRNNSK